MNTYTDATSSTSDTSLTLDKLIEVWNSLKPEIRYCASYHVPKVDLDGNEVVAKLPVRDGYVLLTHPDLLPTLAKRYRLVEFDWEKYAQDELERYFSYVRTDSLKHWDKSFEFKIG